MNEDTPGLRPEFHYSPKTGWMNDPNGMIYYEGEYHLFYQATPVGSHGMSWGHAVSVDLVHWNELPIAISPDEKGDIWSGSAVADWEDTSGFFEGAHGLVAIYTLHNAAQSQALAYSRDRGRTWTKYEGNPVLCDPTPDFRDPKVFRHEPSGKWVMLLAAFHELRFYTSSDLKSWEPASVFGKREDGKIWECPDIFMLPVEDRPGESRWIVHASYFLPDEGPKTETRNAEWFFVGDFDGRVFTPECEAPQLNGYGVDDYAAIHFDSVPGGRGIMMGWLNNWKYAQDVPTRPWKGCATLPRELTLREIDGRLHVCQTPVAELKYLRGELLSFPCAIVSPVKALSLKMNDAAYEITAELKPSGCESFGFSLLRKGDQETRVEYNVKAQELTVDRTKSGNVDYHPLATMIQTAPLALRDGTVRIRIVVDHSTIEIFGNDGEIYFTSLVMPADDSCGCGFFACGGNVTVLNMRFYDMAHHHAA